MTNVERTGTPEDVHGLRRGEFIVLMSVVTATIAISIDTVLPAFDEIEAEFDLNPTSSPVSLTITVFLASMGLGMLVWGPLSDRFGRKPTMFASLALFVVGATVSTLSTSFEMFLVGRAIWGGAAAGPRTISLAITRDAYEGDLMARIMSLTSAVFLLVPIVAPGVGELVLAFGSWRWTTAVGAGLGIIASLWLTRLDETLRPDDVLPLEFGRVARAGRAVLSNRSTMLFTMAALLGYGAFFPWLGSSVQMIGEIYDRPGQFAILFGANAIVMAVTIVAVERLVRRFSTYPVLLAVSALVVPVAIINVVVVMRADGVPSFWLWFASVTVLTALNSGSTPLMQTLAMEPMGKIAGTASSVTGAIVFMGGALLGSVIDGAIDTTVTPFGAGFLIFGSIAFLAVLAVPPARPWGRQRKSSPSQ